jgi:pyruvate dehydrogenase E1 component alpha subunit
MGYSKTLLSGIYTTLYTIRIFETECIKLYRQGLIRGYFHPYLGEEAIATGVCAHLRKGDFITSTHRGHGHSIAHGADLNKMVAELLGKRTGYCRGLGGSMHIADFEDGNIGANGIVGGGMPLGVGAGFSIRMKKEKNVSVIFTTDGASNNGVFCESLNLAAIWNLPVLVVVENNQYAVSTPIGQATREPQLFKRAEALGIESCSIDGNDVFTVYEKSAEALENCRQGRGPQVIEAITFRHGGHHVNDPGTYLPEDKLNHYKAKDPVHTCRTVLLQEYGFSESELTRLENDADLQLQAAIEFARNSDELTIAEFTELVEAC